MLRPSTIPPMTFNKNLALEVDVHKNHLQNVQISSRPIAMSHFNVHNFNEVLPLEDQWYFYNIFKNFVGPDPCEDAPPTPPPTPPEGRRFYAVATIQYSMELFGELLDQTSTYTTLPYPYTYPVSDCYRIGVMEPLQRYMGRFRNPHLSNITFFWN